MKRLTGESAVVVRGGIAGLASAIALRRIGWRVQVLEAVNLVLRFGDPDFIRTAGIYISGIVVVIFIYSGWKGGALVFRHGVGVLDKHSH
ncbi:MAG: DUF2231 domain-containing protein [Pseudomonadota bacterium]